MKKQKLLALLLINILVLTLTGCQAYEGQDEEMEFEKPPAQATTEEWEEDTSSGEEGGGKSLADYVNEGIDEAKRNGLYHESDYPNGTGNSGTDSSVTDSGNTQGSGGTYPSESAEASQEDTLQSLIGEESQANRIAQLALLQYEEEPATEINNNIPYFTEEEIAFAGKIAANSAIIDNAETYSEFSRLDGLGRTGTAYAILNKALMPDDDVIRGDISSVTPTGWVQARYSWIDNGGWLYNRCHLIAWSLTGENANERNLMTGTRYFNVKGMLPYESRTLQYLNAKPENHILYRATPVYSGTELLARGLLLEAYSIEDEGALSFCAYIHNVEPGVDIDYGTGKNEMNDYMKMLKKGGAKKK